MVYLPGIPNATDIPSNSQPQIKENFTQLNTQFSVEHVAFNAASGNGQHLGITLPPNPAGLAFPAGTNWQIRHDSTGVAPNNKESIDVIAPGPKYFPIPLRHTYTAIVIPANTANINLLDLATANLGANASGTLHLYDATSPGRSIFTTFVWLSGTAYLPGTSGQLVSSNSWQYFAMAGTVLRLHTNGSNPAGSGTLIITESRTT
jgi:hypothetical protein